MKLKYVLGMSRRENYWEGTPWEKWGSTLSNQANETDDSKDDSGVESLFNNRVDNKNETKDSELILAFPKPAKNFYGKTPQSQAAQNLSRQFDTSPALQSSFKSRMPKNSTTNNSSSANRPRRYLPSVHPRRLGRLTFSPSKTNRQSSKSPRKPRLMPNPGSNNSRLMLIDNTSQNNISTAVLKTYDANSKQHNLLGTKSDSNSKIKVSGFPNQGLTCYMNATLQALLAQPSFFNMLLSLEKQIKKWPSRGILERLCKLAKYKEESNAIRINTGLICFRRELIKLHPQFVGKRNQDAHEFLVVLCDAIENQCSEYIKMRAFPENELQCNLETVATKVDTLISRNFEFEQKETKKCLICNETKETFTKNYIFKLDIPTKESLQGRLSIRQLISNTLNSTCKLPCSSCTAKKKELGFEIIDDTVKVSDTFVSLPKCLIFYLPRIEIYKVIGPQKEGESNVRFRKNQIPIEISDTLSMSAFMEMENKDNAEIETQSDNKTPKRCKSEISSSGSPAKKMKLSSTDIGDQHSPTFASTHHLFAGDKITSSPMIESKPAALTGNINIPENQTTALPSPIKSNENAASIDNYVDSYLNHNYVQEDDTATSIPAIPPTPEKFKNLTPAKVANLNESDQIELALKESMKAHSTLSTSQFESLPIQNTPISPIKTTKQESFPFDESDSPPKKHSAFQTPDKLKNLSAAEVKNLSESDQLQLALKESMKTQSSVSTSQFGSLADLTEEEQMSRAINASMQESKLTEDDQLIQAMEKSLENSNSPSLSESYQKNDWKENMSPSKSKNMMTAMGDSNLSVSQTDTTKMAGKIK